MDQKEILPRHVEVSDHGNDAAKTDLPPEQQGTTKLMVFFALYIGLAAWMYNFDLGKNLIPKFTRLLTSPGYSGIVLLMPPYNKAFGECVSIPTPAGVHIEKCSLTALQQSLISVTLLFIALGGALAGIVGNYVGRRGTIQVGCVLVIIGAGGMLGTSGNFTAYMVCKCIQGVGLGHLMGSAPVYGVECTAANKRGMLMALFNYGLSMGNMVAAAVCLGTSHYRTNLSWQIPIICQIPLAFILGLGVMMFPESPRWLLVKGKEAAARKSFARFYAKDPQSSEISKQMQEVLYYIELEKATGSTTNWTEIFHGTDLRRTATAVLLVVGVGITGSKFISTYSAIFLGGVGISNPFVIVLVVAACAFAGAVPSPWIVEYGGRRFSVLVGYGCMALFMLIIAAVGSGVGAQTSTAKKVLVAFLCLWALIYGAFVGPSLATTAPEMHSVRLRTYGQACSTMFFEIFSFGASFYTPYMLSPKYGNMGLNVGYFYFGRSHISAGLRNFP